MQPCSSSQVTHRPRRAAQNHKPAAAVQLQVTNAHNGWLRDTIAAVKRHQSTNGAAQNGKPPVPCSSHPQPRTARAVPLRMTHRQRCAAASDEPG